MYFKMIYPKLRSDQGNIKLRLSLPSVFTSMCGRFVQVSDNSLHFFGSLEVVDIWVVVHEERVRIYSNCFAGEAGLTREISCHRVISVQDIQFDCQSEGCHEALRVCSRLGGGIQLIIADTFTEEDYSYSSSETHVAVREDQPLRSPTRLVWGWAEDTAQQKGMWKRILSRS